MKYIFLTVNQLSCLLLIFKIIVFQGMERTERSHFGGGDTAWEEEKLGSYATSEVRFVEIQEHLCEDERAKDQVMFIM